MSHLPPRLTAAAALAALAFASAACGTTDDPGADSGTASGPPAEAVSADCAKDTTATATDPVSLVDGAGRTVELERPASRVAVLEWQQTEDLLTLCVAPVAVADPEGYGTFVSAEKLPDGVVDVGQRGEFDFDALYAADPDLIVVEAAGVDDAVVAKLEERDIPVLVTVGADASGQIDNMKKVFTMIAEATGRTERAAEVLGQFDQHLATAKEKVQDVSLSTTDFLFFDGWIEGGNLVIRPYGRGALFTELGEQLGLTSAWTDAIDSAYGSGGVDPAYGLAQTDIEGLTAVGDANLFYSDDDTPDSYVAELGKSPVWTSLPAVQEGRAHAFPPGVWGAGGPKSNEQAIDAYVDILTNG
jgi:iron complex transport system substrate-binding protein